MISIRCQKWSQGALESQLKLEVPQQHVHETIQAQKQPHSQAKGIQPVEVYSNKPQQLVMAKIFFHHILVEQKARRGQQVPSTSYF
jgi:hypothetical protein